MYDKIQQGKHIKKVNRIENDPKDTAAATTVKNPKGKEIKILTVQQLNV